MYISSYSARPRRITVKYDVLVALDVEHASASLTSVEALHLPSVFASVTVLLLVDVYLLSPFNLLQNKRKKRM